MVGKFSYVENCEGWNKRHTFTNTNGKVTQGSVLGPLLFLIKRNKRITTLVKSEMGMFADDMTVWCRIETERDGIFLQEDLDKLSLWSETWQIKFKAEKCTVMHIGHSCRTDYYMTGGLSGKTKLESV